MVARSPHSSQAGTVVTFEVPTPASASRPRAEDHLRGVPAGRRGHQPQVRRNRLGLAISRELSNLLGGENPAPQLAGHRKHLHLYLPLNTSPSVSLREPARQHLVGHPALSPVVRVVADATPEHIPDDRASLHRGDCPCSSSRATRTMRGAGDLGDIEASKYFVATRGAEALDLAREFHSSAVSLDVFLPDMLGWTVLSHLKQDATFGTSPCRSSRSTRTDNTGCRAARSSFITKPATTEGLEAAFDRIRDFAVPRRKRLLSRRRQRQGA